MGVLASLILGPFQGWGAAVAGAITAGMAGLTAQFANMVVPKEVRHLAQYGRRYRGLGATRAIAARNGGSRVSVMSGLGRGKGMGLVYAQDSNGMQTGRTPGGFIPESVLAQANMGAFGQGGLGM